VKVKHLTQLIEKYDDINNLNKAFKKANINLIKAKSKIDSDMRAFLLANKYININK
jgi:hypothetical protein